MYLTSTFLTLHKLLIPLSSTIHSIFLYLFKFSLLHSFVPRWCCVNDQDFVVFFSYTTAYSYLAWVWWSHWIVLFHKILTISFFITPSGWYSYHLSPLLSLCLPQSFQCTNLAMLLYLCLYYFWVNIWVFLFAYSFCLFLWKTFSLASLLFKIL